MEFCPDPSGEVFAGGVFEAWHFVETVVIDPLFDGLEGSLDIRKVEHPAEFWIDRAADVYLDLKAVPVHPSALVARRDVGKPVRRLNAELLENLQPCLLTNTEQFVRLQAQPPLGMLHAISDGEAGVANLVWSIHGLQEKVLELQMLELRWVERILRIDQLEFAPRLLHEGCAGFRADADPVNARWGLEGAVSFHGDFEVQNVERFNQGRVELKEGFSSGADNKFGA